MKYNTYPDISRLQYFSRIRSARMEHRGKQCYENLKSDVSWSLLAVHQTVELISAGRSSQQRWVVFEWRFAANSGVLHGSPPISESEIQRLLDDIQMQCSKS
jgi:hypothetical protein